MILKNESERQVAALLKSESITPEQAKVLQALLAKATNDLLNEVEAGRYLRVTVKCLQAWRGRRWGPRFTKLGRRVYYTRAELDQFIDRRMVQTEGSPGDEPPPVTGIAQARRRAAA